jgi:hypothetical protein
MANTARPRRRPRYTRPPFRRWSGRL